MPIRPFVLILLLGASVAGAAPPRKNAAQETPPATESIDVDALARAKDGKPSEPAPVPAETASDATAVAQAAGEAPPADAAAPPSESAPPDEEATRHAPPLAVPSAEAMQERRAASACEARAKSLLDAAQKGDYAAATRDFDAKMRSALPVPKFKQAWESLAQFGALQARGQSHPIKGEGYIAVTVPLVFEKANLYAQVACGSDGLVAGFYVKPLETPQP